MKTIVYKGKSYTCFLGCDTYIGEFDVSCFVSTMWVCGIRPDPWVLKKRHKRTHYFVHIVYKTKGYTS